MPKEVCLERRKRRRPTAPVRMSGYQLLSDGLGRRVSGVTSPEFDLHFLASCKIRYLPGVQCVCDNS
jgi:hypothetical protein